MKKTSTVYLVAFAVTLFVVSLFISANAQLSSENLFKAPFISAGNSQQSMQSVMQNSEKDIVFIENLGQIIDSKGKKRPDILFLTCSQGVDMYITSTGITYVFRKTEGDVREKASMRKSKVEEPKTSLYRLDMEFVGMNKNINIKKELAIEQKFNYYTPEYPNGISPKAYKKITLENIYDGIDLVYYEKEGKMKYDFVVKAGTDPNIIRTKYKGAGTVYIDKNGSVIVTTPMGEIREEEPYTYSRNTGKEIENGYEVRNNLVQFDIAEYNKSEDIIIDPYRIWATYYGGSNIDYVYSLCTDNTGNLYVTGGTRSTDFPIKTLTGAYNQTIYGGSIEDAYILKFNRNGVRLWATYYGGNGEDRGLNLCTDNSGNIFVTGYTSGVSFPLQTLAGAYNQNSLGGQNDVFILKFNSSGLRLWATYYGGSGSDYGNDICMDSSNNLYVTGNTTSTNFPTQKLAGAYNDTTHNGGSFDAFVLKFNVSCARLWATYYGGSGNDYGNGICTNNSDNLYATGYTGSYDIPTEILTGAYNQSTFGGGSFDAFILRFDSVCARLWATYYGGSGSDYGNSICTDNSNNLSVAGSTGSTNFPIQNSSGAYNDTTLSGSSDVFILKFNNSCIRLWATYYGGSVGEGVKSICFDISGALYVTGFTSSTNFPLQVLPGAYNQTTSGGGSGDAFVLKFNSNSTRMWATYYGGNNWDYGYKIVYSDTSNAFYVAGASTSTNFPTLTLSGAYNQNTYSGNYDGFILKFNSTPPSGIKNISNAVPGKYYLFQNYPNPFNPKTNIKFNLPKTNETKLIVYNGLGREVAILVNEKLNAGHYEYTFDGTGLTSGVYFYRINTGEFVETKKMLLLK